MRPNSKQFAPQYASMFGDASVVHAYQIDRPILPKPLRFSSVFSILTRHPVQY